MDQEMKKKSPAELRKEECERIQSELEQQGYRCEAATISILKANLMVFATSVPVCLFVLFIFIVINHGLRALSEAKGWALFPVLVLLSIPVHELLHGLGWLPACKNGWKSIRFGVMWSSLTPYCNCKEPMNVKSYYRGLLLPFSVLGILPSIAAVVTGSMTLLALGMMNFLFAGGDLAIALVIRKYLGKQVLLLDHPSECGSLAFLKEE